MCRVLESLFKRNEEHNDPDPDPFSRRESAPVNQADDSHVFYSWSAQAAIKPMLIAGAEGSYVFDDAGKRYLDFSCQLVNTNIGHQHPKVVAAIKAQADRLCTVSPLHANETRNEAARLICELAPAGMNKVFFTCDGSEAVEHATRMARLHTGRIKLLSTYRSYHGSTTTATNLTGEPRRWPNDYGSAGTVHFFGPFLYRSPFHSSSEEEESTRALEHLEQVVALRGALDDRSHRPRDGPRDRRHHAPAAGLSRRRARASVDRHGIVFITDEVMAGFGRTGKWFAFENYGVVPDLITFAKGVNSGYVPLGGVIISDAIAASFDERVYAGGHTYSGHPLACAAAVATINAMKEERIVENAAWIGENVLGPGLRELAAKHPLRRRGARPRRVLGPRSREGQGDARADRPYGGTSPAMADLLAACKEGGLLPFMKFNRLHAVPPCNVSEAEAREGIAILDEALVAADAYCTS